MTFGKWGSATEHERYMAVIEVDGRKNKKNLCGCGCKQKATHRGMANGVCLIIGCELHMRRWVRDGVHAGIVTEV